MTSFFSNYLLDQQAYTELLSGYVVPPSVSAVGTTVLFSDQPERWVQYTVDDSQDVPADVSTNSLGLPNTGSAVTVFTEESLRYQAVPDRNHYTHDTDGLRAGWRYNRGSITFEIGDKSIWPSGSRYVCSRPMVPTLTRDD